ncbi:MAG TPA: alginate export family protein [Sphingobium sp.]
MTIPLKSRLLPSAFPALAALAALALPNGAHAKSGDLPTLQAAIGDPDDFKLSGSTRLRYEALGGQARAGFGESEDLVSLRTILTAEYRTGNVRAGAEMYDSRVFGIEPGSVVSTNEVNAFELVQAYVAVSFPDALGKGSKSSLQFGRMMLNLGSRRLVAADEYRNTTNGYTGIRADTSLANGFGATAFYTLPQSRLPEDLASIRRAKVQIDRENFDLQLWGGYVTKSRAIGRTMAEIGYVGLAEKDAPGRPTRDRRLQSLSGRLIADPKAGLWDYEVEGIYQFGTVSSATIANAPTLDVSAYFLHADAGYSFPSKWKVHLSVEYDLASGDGPGGRYGRFDTLFGMRRADLSPAGIYSQIGRSNISAPGIRLEVTPSARLDSFVTYKGLWLANRFDSFATTGVRDTSGASGNFAGQQFDTRLRWWVVPKGLRAELTGTWLIKGRFLRYAPNAPATGNVRYAAVALTANF